MRVLKVRKRAPSRAARRAVCLWILSRPACDVQRASLATGFLATAFVAAEALRSAAVLDPDVTRVVTRTRAVRTVQTVTATAATDVRRTRDMRTQCKSRSVVLVVVEGSPHHGDATDTKSVGS